MTFEEVEEADDDHYQMIRFHYMLTSEEERRNELRLLAEEAVTTENEVSGVLSRESHRYSTDYLGKEGVNCLMGEGRERRDDGKRYHKSHDDAMRRKVVPVGAVKLKLCGSGTLAAAHVLFKSGTITTDVIEVVTLSGVLTAKKVVEVGRLDSSKFSDGCTEEYSIELNFPTVELSSGEAVANLQPQFDEIEKCSGRGVIVTGVAPAGSGFDLFSRFFCPKFGVKEVTLVIYYL
ncbi:hypothetical protein GIB67_041476 [Kingdonia uniflora]|uniref:Uncharacterized protein n=1 Tax=Kingdonia uniflora TaxID=39325 RepID=A0A7J7LRK3_9MAGN|nr:hypothetical protein GIB67_041476 [Kingdonia uniflora]